MCRLRDRIFHELCWTGNLLVLHLLHCWKICIFGLHYVDKQLMLRLFGGNLFAWRSDDLHFLCDGVLQRRRRSRRMHELHDVLRRAASNCGMLCDERPNLRRLQCW